MTDAIQALVGKLIGLESNTFTEDDAEVLSGFTEERLGEMIAKCEETAAAPVAPAEPATATAASDGANATPPEGFALVPEEELADMRSAAKAYAASEKARKAQLIGAVKAADVNDAYDDATLEAMDNAGLERLRKALAGNVPAPDYSGQGPAVPDSIEPVDPNPPGSLSRALGYNLMTGEKLEAPASN